MERMIHLQWLTPNRYRVLLEGREIGIWKDPECSAARHLLEHGLAAPDDMLATNRVLRGSVGWFAQHRVDESGTPRFARWKPFPVVSGPEKTALAENEAERPQTG